MDVHILSNSHAKQKQNGKKAFDQIKKKVESEWDKFQTRM
jgi:hypothetical protein